MNAATDFLPASGLLAQLDLLLIEHAGAVTHLRLNRPAKRNAINEALMRQLHTALLNLPASTRALVVSGEGAHFCAGLDLSDLSERSVAEGVLHSRGWHVVMDALQFCSVPVSPNSSASAKPPALRSRVCNSRIRSTSARCRSCSAIT